MSANMTETKERRRIYDLVVIGGGVNGVWIARDAVGRGLKVLLCEQDDLASATSSASSKLIHGGLRYLEQREFRLVRESLKEREIQRQNAHHLIHPMRFVLPVGPNSRPRWMLQLGLWLYDRIGGFQTLPKSNALDLTDTQYRGVLKTEFANGFVYSDCWVDDARYVVLNAVDAARRGAEICTRTRCIGARREGNRWRVELDTGEDENLEVRARAIVNAAGPWVSSVLTNVLGTNTSTSVKLVRGSHIVVPRLYDGDHAHILQADDRRVVFVMPFEGVFSLIGTTDVEVDAEEDGRIEPPHIDEAESVYLCDTLNQYFEKQISPEDVVWSFSGVRPL